MIYWFGLANYIDLSCHGKRCFVMGSILRCSIPVTERDRHVCIIATKGKKMGFIHTWVYLVYIMSSFLRRYSILYGLNTLDACWIAVDVWSNSSRCRQELVYLSQTWCLYTWSLPWIRHNYLLFYQFPNSNLFTHRMFCAQERSL